MVSGVFRYQIRDRQKNILSIFRQLCRWQCSKELDYQVPFFTMQLNRQINGRNDDCWGMVRDAQARAAKRDTGRICFDNFQFKPYAMDIHNTAQANVAL